MNGARFFLDTNILVYRFDRTAPAKAARANQLLASGLALGQGVASLQVASEFCNVMLRKVSGPFRPEDLRDFLQRAVYPLVVVHAATELLTQGLGVWERYQMAWYDALIVAAAQLAHCSILYSEDFQHGARFDGVRVVDPFR